jgi:TPR repeat protein
VTGVALTLTVLLAPPLRAQETQPTAEPGTEEGTPPAAETPETGPTTQPAVPAGPGEVESGLPDDASEAARDAAQRCDQGDWVACAELGTMYFAGNGVPMDLNRGDELTGRAQVGLMEACEGGDNQACDDLQYHFGDTPGE